MTTTRQVIGTEIGQSPTCLVVVCSRRQGEGRVWRSRSRGGPTDRPTDRPTRDWRLDRELARWPGNGTPHVNEPRFTRWRKMYTPPRPADPRSFPNERTRSLFQVLSGETGQDVLLLLLVFSSSPYLPQFGIGLEISSFVRYAWSVSLGSGSCGVVYPKFEGRDIRTHRPSACTSDDLCLQEQANQPSHATSRFAGLLSWVVASEAGRGRPRHVGHGSDDR